MNTSDASKMIITLPTVVVTAVVEFEVGVVVVEITSTRNDFVNVD